MDANVFTPEVVDECREIGYARCRTDFSLYRRYIRPEMVWGEWWLQELAYHFQNFYRDFKAGKRPKLILMAPPQHGKSWNVEDFIAWVAGNDPDLKTMFASYSEELGVKTNLSLQRVIRSDRYQDIFPRTWIGDRGWKCDTSVIEYVGAKGSFRNTTVGGQINGLEQHLGIIDDPVKGRIEANSKLTRDKTWDWFIDDFKSRFNKNSGLIICMTRWHVDDVVGRALEMYPEAKVLRYPAIAEVNGKKRKEGDALFPEWKPLDFLAERRREQSQAGWSSLYQQHPIIVGGGMFPVEKFYVVPMFNRTEIANSVRYWDKAGSTTTDACYTAGVLMHRLFDGRYVVEHVCRGQWSALDRERTIRNWAEIDAKHCPSYEIVVEQEPGSGGKESAENTVRLLAGFTVHADKVSAASGNKEVRAQPYAAQVEGGNVGLVAGEWCGDFVDEHETFPTGKYVDQVDAASGAFNWVAMKSTYDYSYRGWNT